MSQQVEALLEKGGFWIGRFIARGFIAQCLILTAFSAILIILASVLDGTFFLSGRNVGLFEHPAIWSFLILQIALPLSLRHSLKRITGPKVEKLDSPLGSDFSEVIACQLSTCVSLHNRTGKLIASTCYIIGFAAFVWNSYQNQLPNVIVPFDFWDSINHPWGYWVTRGYKFYLYVWLLPYIGFIHIALLSCLLQIIRKRRIHGYIKLQPFHPDNAGGFGFLPGLITTPIIVTLLICSFPLAGAFKVHQAFDITPMIGAGIVCFGAFIAYIIPILYLRKDIIALKNNTLEKIRVLQQKHYISIIEEEEINIEALKRGGEAIDYFDKICKRLDSISNYPHFVRLLRYIGLAMSPSFFLLALKLYQTFGSALIPLLKNP